MDVQTTPRFIASFGSRKALIGAVVTVTGGCAYVAGRSFFNAYHQVSYYEFIPVDHRAGLVMRRVKAIWNTVLAYWRFQWRSLFGLTPVDVRQLSMVINESTERKVDLRPIMVPSGEAINIFPCNSVHSHPRSAEFRSSANNFLVNLVRSAGYEPYVVSGSRRDTALGSRYYYNVKDLGMDYRDDAVPERAALVFIDVDYYADMPRWLSLWKPICMYTLYPTQLTYAGVEFQYTFRGKELSYCVAGGAEYTHGLWDYRGDTVTATDVDGNLLVYDIEQRTVLGDEQHRLIWLLPKARVSDAIWRFAGLDWADKQLKRRDLGNAEAQILWDPISDTISLALKTSPYSVEMSGKLFNSIKIRMANKEATPYVSDVERMLKEEKHPNATRDAPFVFHCLGCDIVQKKGIVKTTAFPATFQALAPGGLATEDVKNPGAVCTTPLTSSPALFAAKGLNADVVCVTERLNKVKNRMPFTQKYTDLSREFVELLVPEHLAGTGVPLSHAEVRRRQDKKMQVMRFDRVAETMSLEAENKIKAFIKTEPYPSAKAPRNISGMSTEITVISSSYSLPFADILKQAPWYCPGKKPREIIDRLATVMRFEPGEDLEEGDYSFLDGTQSKDLEAIHRRAMLRWLSENHRGGYIKVHRQIYKNSAVTTAGYRYYPEWSIRSGSSVTSQGGSLVNAFVVYCAIRDLGFDACGAWSRIGAIFGDDSVNANFRGEFRGAVERVARDLGLIYKSNLRLRGTPIQFLGRYFVDPSTTYDSFADPMRTIGKLHLSANKNVSPAQAATNKAIGYLTTDHLTPIIGTWAKRVVQITGLKFKHALGEEQYRCSNAWPQKDRSAIATAMALVLGITTGELLEKDAAVAKAAGLDAFPVLFDTTYDHKVTAVVDGLVVRTDLHNSSNEDGSKPLPQPEAGPRSISEADVNPIRRGSEHVATDSAGLRDLHPASAKRGPSRPRAPGHNRNGANRRGGKPARGRNFRTSQRN